MKIIITFVLSMLIIQCVDGQATLKSQNLIYQSVGSIKQIIPVKEKYLILYETGELVLVKEGTEITWELPSTIDYIGLINDSLFMTLHEDVTGSIVKLIKIIDSVFIEVDALNHYRPFLSYAELEESSFVFGSSNAIYALGIMNNKLIIKDSIKTNFWAFDIVGNKTTLCVDDGSRNYYKVSLKSKIVERINLRANAIVLDISGDKLWVYEENNLCLYNQKRHTKKVLIHDLKIEDRDFISLNNTELNKYYKFDNKIFEIRRKKVKLKAVLTSVNYSKLLCYKNILFVETFKGTYFIYLFK